MMRTASADARSQWQSILQLVRNSSFLFKKSALVACPCGNTWWMAWLVDAEMLGRIGMI